MQPLLGVRHHEGTHRARTSGGQANAESMIRLLNDALATEIIKILCYRYQYFMTAGIRSRHMKAQFLEYVAETRADADQLAERIVQLGGRPDVSPERLIGRTHAEYVEVDSVGGMFAADLLTRIAIKHYREMTVSLGAEDLTTQQIVEMILAQEESHAERRVSLVRGGAAFPSERFVSQRCLVLHEHNAGRRRRTYAMPTLSRVSGMRSV